MKKILIFAVLGALVIGVPVVSKLTDRSGGAKEVDDPNNADMEITVTEVGNPVNASGAMREIAEGSHRFVVYDMRIRFRTPARLGCPARPRAPPQRKERYQ